MCYCNTGDGRGRGKHLNHFFPPLFVFIYFIAFFNMRIFKKKSTNTFLSSDFISFSLFCGISIFKKWAVLWVYFSQRFILAAGKDRALMGFDLSRAEGSRGSGQRNYPWTHVIVFFLNVCANKYSLIVNELYGMVAW